MFDGTHCRLITLKFLPQSMNVYHTWKWKLRNLLFNYWNEKVGFGGSSLIKSENKKLFVRVALWCDSFFWIAGESKRFTLLLLIAVAAAIVFSLQFFRLNFSVKKKHHLKGCSLKLSVYLNFKQIYIENKTIGHFSCQILFNDFAHKRIQQIIYSNNIRN